MSADAAISLRGLAQTLQFTGKTVLLPILFALKWDRMGRSSGAISASEVGVAMGEILLCLMTIVLAGVALSLLFAPLVSAVFVVEACWDCRYRFRLTHLGYAIAMLAGALATLGDGGVVIGPIVLVAWAGVASSRSKTAAWSHALAGASAALVVGGLLTFVPQAREDARRMQCSGKLKQLGLALHNYHDAYGQFPPAFIADETGEPIHSWRVLLLPYMEQQSLYAQYDFGEPWDGPNNRKLLDYMPPNYRCPSWDSSDAARASYVAVVGGRSAWPAPRGRTLTEFPDGTSRTLLVVEAPDRQPLWTEPRDLGLDEAVQLFDACYPGRQGGHRRKGFFRDLAAGWQVVMADGSVHYVSHATAPSTWRSALRVDDGIGLPVDWYGLAGHPGGAFRWGSLYRFVLFLLIALWPLPWFLRKWARAEQQPSRMSADPETTSGEASKSSSDPRGINGAEPD